MAATTAGKTKYRLFKVAAEINIGKETISEFLRNKGFDITDKPTASLTQEMYDLVMDKFEKEHRQVEKQRKKVDAYHMRRTRVKPKTKEEEAEEQKATEETAKAAVPDADEQKEKQAEAEEPIQAEAPEEEVAQDEAAEKEEEVVEEAPEESIAEAEEQVEEVLADEVEETPKEADKKQKDVQALEPDEEVAEATPVETDETAAEETEEEVVAEKQKQEKPVAEKPKKTASAQTEETETEEPQSVEETPVEDEADEEKVDIEEQEEETEEDIDTKKEDSGPIKKPKLKGLSVVGKIAIEKKTVPEKKKRRKRKRIRESTSVDINAESRGGGKPKPTGDSAATGSDKKRKRRGRGASVDQDEVARSIKETFSRMEDKSGSSRQKRSRLKRDEREEKAQKEMQEQLEQEKVLHVAEYATVSELANLMNVDVGQVISKCIALGLMVSINQRLEKDTIQLVADEFGFNVEFEEEYAEDLLSEDEEPEETLLPRAPIVTIMGHVDHGKTSLLDYVRSANVVAGESGGITQHIGAYSVELEDDKKITFLDTPGHEAFTAMRARGAQVTDIVVLIVAADDSVMPQTVEAISHAQAAGVPIVVAINKVDKPEANPERIKQQLADRGVLVEEWGGKYQAVAISAKTGLGVDKLLETILLEAEILELKANPDRNARGVIIEAEIDKGKGVVATALVQKGTLKVGDPFIAGQYSGRIRAMLDERGHRIKEVGPSEPAQILGLAGVPGSGDVFVVVDSEQEAKEIATKRQQLRREQEFKQARRITLDDISQQIALGGVQNLPLIIKGDVDGSVEALADALLRLSTPEVQVSVIMKSVGEISENDVLLAAASNAIIIGFHVRPNLKARKLAEREGVDIRTYQIIYDTVNEVRAALEGMLVPDEKEVVSGTAEVRDIFKISRIGTIAGCYVLDGKITRNDKVRLLRDGFEVFTGSIASLKRIKEDVREVEQGFECGIGLENMNDVKVGDIIEAFKMVEVKRKLESTTAAS